MSKRQQESDDKAEGSMLREGLSYAAMWLYLSFCIVVLPVGLIVALEWLVTGTLEAKWLVFALAFSVMAVLMGAARGLHFAHLEAQGVPKDQQRDIVDSLSLDVLP